MGGSMVMGPPLGGIVAHGVKVKETADEKCVGIEINDWYKQG